MSRHDDLLARGPHAAPEPQTAEQRTGRLGKVVRRARFGVLGAIAAAILEPVWRALHIPFIYLLGAVVVVVGTGALFGLGERDDGDEAA